MLLKYGRPVVKNDISMRVTQGPTMDGPFGDQLSEIFQLGFAENIWERKRASGQTIIIII